MRRLTIFWGTIAACRYPMGFLNAYFAYRKYYYSLSRREVLWAASGAVFWFGPWHTRRDKIERLLTKERWIERYPSAQGVGGATWGHMVMYWAILCYRLTYTIPVWFLRRSFRTRWHYLAVTLFDRSLARMTQPRPWYRMLENPTNRKQERAE